MDEKNPYYLDSLGSLYLKMNNLTLAQKYFIDALKHNPNEPVILYHYSKALKQMRNEMEAAKTLGKARTIILDMLIYSIESDSELKSIEQTISKK